MKTIKHRRRRSKSASTDKFYFTADTQAAIVEFQSEQGASERHVLYVSRIEPAFSTLVDNLIRINKYEGLFKTREELKHDCVTFLYETLGKFDNSRGSAAFSYFNVVAKNWLTVSSRSRAARLKKMISVDSDMTRDSAINMLHRRADAASDKPSPDAPDLVKMLDCLESQRDTFSEQEHKCFDAIKLLCSDPEIVAGSKRTHIMGALKGLAGDGRDFSIGIAKLRQRYREIRDAELS